MKISSKKIFVSISCVLVFIFLFKQAQSNGDFKVFLEAAKLLNAHQNIYDVWITTAKDVACLYFYSPLFALLLIPFSNIPNPVTNFIWLLACFIWTIRIWKLIEQRLEMHIFSNKEKTILIVLSFLLVFRFLLYNFGLIQLTVFLLWSILESISLFDKNKNIKGSFLLALAINIKLLPIVVLPYLIYQKRFVPTLMTLTFFIILLFLPSIFIGVDFNNFLLHEWWKTINPVNEGHVVETGMGVHSLTALIPSLLMETNGELELKRNIYDLSPVTVNVITNIARVIFILWTFYFLIQKNKKVSSNHQIIWQISYLTLVIPLIFPHQQKYAFFLLLPASAYIIYFLMVTFKNNYDQIGKVKWVMIICLIFISFALMTLSTDGIIGRYYNQISQHFKTITYGTIILSMVLTICNPKYLLPVVTPYKNNLT